MDKQIDIVLSSPYKRAIDTVRDFAEEKGKNIVIGSHGTALSTIINYYGETFGYSDFDKIRNLMPWVVQFTFGEKKCVKIQKYNQKSVLDIIKDFFNVKQLIISYLLVIMFLLIIFGGTIISKGFQVQSMWIPVLLFLKALAFGGIEEIGWRYAFQPVMERMVTYIPAVYGFVL